MVYVGGTDNGRWIPELLNETSGGDSHIVITQNALAAGDYQDYLQLQYDGQLANLSEDESQQAFSQYVSEAQKRLLHDQQFPDEPRQIRPGEDVRMVEGKVQVSGQVAVMGINDLLLQKLMQKNPELSFGIEESFPLGDTYGSALPLGPLMELNAASQDNTFTAEKASQSVDYWRNAAQQLLDDPDASTSEAALRSYSHDVAAAANLLAAHDFSGEAEQAYRLATQLWPGNPESVGRLANLLMAGGRNTEAQQLLQNFSQNYPDQQQALDRIRAGTTLLWNSQPPPK
jgi:ribosomal protein L16/L10AE